MRDPFLKRGEIYIRRILIHVLRLFVRRRKRFLHTNDINSCKLLFIRHDKIGDVLISTPIFASIKNHYPTATVDVLLSTHNYFVLENDPFIRTRWIYYKSIHKTISLLRFLRKEKYDYAIDMMVNPSATSTFLCLFAGAQQNVGIAKENSYVYDILVPMLSRTDAHIVDRTAQLLTPFHIDPAKETLSIQYFTSPEADTFAEQFLSENKLVHHMLIGINISAGDDARFWGIKNYCALLLFIMEEHPELCPIILYKSSDVKRANLIAESNIRTIISPATITFDQYAAIIKKLSFLVSPDTSAIHLASAFGIPSVVLYRQSDKNLRIWEPYHVECETLVTEADSLSSIPLNEVVTACKRLFTNTQRSRLVRKENYGKHI